MRHARRQHMALLLLGRTASPESAQVQICASTHTTQHTALWSDIDPKNTGNSEQAGGEMSRILACPEARRKITSGENEYTAASIFRQFASR